MNARRFSVCFFYTLLSVLAGAQETSDWPQWRGLNRDGVAQSFLSPAAWKPDSLVRKWSVSVGEGHASPIIAGDKGFVPTTSGEESAGQAVNYACCTFRGSLVALDANTGAVAWKTYMVDENRPRARNAQGVQMFGPAGGGICSHGQGRHGHNDGGDVPDHTHGAQRAPRARD